MNWIFKNLLFIIAPIILCVSLSGWMYTVNGEFPGRGCSQYELKPGDIIEWIFTCDLGRDIGGDGAALGGAGQTSGGEE